LNIVSPLSYKAPSFLPLVHERSCPTRRSCLSFFWPPLSPPALLSLIYVRNGPPTSPRISPLGTIFHLPKWTGSSLSPFADASRLFSCQIQSLPPPPSIPYGRLVPPPPLHVTIATTQAPYLVSSFDLTPEKSTTPTPLFRLPLHSAVRFRASKPFPRRLKEMPWADLDPL